MAKHPYENLPWQSWWREAVTRLPSNEIDPSSASSIRISPETKIGTAGSCFAQNVSHALNMRGFSHYVVEPGPEWLPEDQAREYNYGVFSARYGNIYTARQLWQLLQRAYGEFESAEADWRNGAYWIDPLRPHIQPDGFASSAELEADRKAHLRQVRRLFEEVDLFVFTLGLTESWRSKHDGTILPVCPGGRRGTFDAGRYEFHNFTVAEVTQDLAEFCTRFHQINPSAQILLTVSPVPLIATMEPRHVLSATTYSKSVLRVAAEQTTQDFDHVEYFPSYEIITGTYCNKQYYAEDRRSVTPLGIEHVMNCFFGAYSEQQERPLKTNQGQEERVTSAFAEANLIVRELCDEEKLLEHLQA